MRKAEDLNDDLDEDKDFEDCDKNWISSVADENTNLGKVKGLNPKSQSHNSVG